MSEFMVGSGATNVDVRESDPANDRIRSGKTRIRVS